MPAIFIVASPAIFYLTFILRSDQENVHLIPKPAHLFIPEYF